VFQSAGSQKEVTKKGKKGKKNKQEVQRQAPAKPAPRPNNPPKATAVDAEDDDDAQVTVASDVDMLNALTGCPVAEDELLFAVPVVAPYSALSSYK